MDVLQNAPLGSEKEELKLLKTDSKDSDTDSDCTTPSAKFTTHPDIDGPYGSQDSCLQHEDYQSTLLPTTRGRTITAYKIFKTASLVYVWFILGLFTAIVNSTLLSLGLRTGSHMDELGRAGTFKFVGIVVGALCGGALSDRVRKKMDLIIAVSLSLAGVMITAKPLVHSLRLLEVTFAGEGLAYGCISSAGNSMCLMIWGPSASAPLQAVHFGFGVGMTIAPLIVRPFLPNRYSMTAVSRYNSTTASSLLNGSSISSTPIAFPNDTSTIEYAYLIAGILTFVASIMFYLLAYVGIPHGLTLHGCTKKSLKEIVHPSSCGASATFTVQLLLTLGPFFFFQTGHEYSLRPYIFSYAVKGDLHLSSDQAAYLDASYSLAFTCSRGLTILAAYFCRIQILLFGEVFLLVGISICSVLLGFKSEFFLWTSSCAVAVASAPINPSGLAWADRYIAVSATVVSLMNVLGGFGGMFAIGMSGYTFEHNSPRSPYYVGLVTSLGMCLVLIIMQIVASIHGDRYTCDTKKSSEYTELRDTIHH